MCLFVAYGGVFFFSSSDSIPAYGHQEKKHNLQQTRVVKSTGTPDLCLVVGCQRGEQTLSRTEQ